MGWCIYAEEVHFKEEEEGGEEEEEEQVGSQLKCTYPDWRACGFCRTKMLH